MDHPVSSARRLSCVLASVCLMAGCAWSPCLHAAAKQGKPHKESKRADTREIEAMETKWRDAMVHGDTAALDKMLSDDFLGISANGTVSDKQQYVQRLARRQNEFTTIELMDLKVRMKPPTAIAVSQARVTGEVNGRTTNGVYRYTKVYGREAGVWRVLNFEATRVSGPQANDPDMRGGTPLTSSVPTR